MVDPGYQYVVVGAGMAGGRAAEALARRAESVALVGAETSLPYARPPLSKDVLTANAQPADLEFRDRAFYAARHVDLFLGSAALGLDTTARALKLSSGDVMKYGTLLLAPGVVPARLPVPGTELAGVHHLRTIDDAARLRQELPSCRKAVVVGGGFIGCETAASLRARGIAVELVAQGDGLLSEALGHRMGAILTRRHREAGVTVHLNSRVTELRGSARVEGVVTDEGHEISCDLVVIGVGSRLDLDWLAGAGLAVDDGIIVDEYCRASVPGVFAAGDAARGFSRRLNRHIRVEHESHAQNQAVAAARNMLGIATVYDAVPYAWSRQYDLDVWHLGDHIDGADVEISGNEQGYEFVAVYHSNGQTTGVLGVNLPAILPTARKFLERCEPFTAKELMSAQG